MGDKSKLVKCKVCKSRLKPERARTIQYKYKDYDVMDCPNCGCEVILKKVHESTVARIIREIR